MSLTNWSLHLMWLSSQGRSTQEGFCTSTSWQWPEWPGAAAEVLIIWCVLEEDEVEEQYLFLTTGCTLDLIQLFPAQQVDINHFRTAWVSCIVHPGRTMLSMWKMFKSAGLIINLTLCAIARRESEYLGFVIGGEIIKPQEHKFEAIQKCPLPQNNLHTTFLLGQLLLQIWHLETLQSSCSGLKRPERLLRTYRMYCVISLYCTVLISQNNLCCRLMPPTQVRCLPRVNWTRGTQWNISFTNYVQGPPGGKMCCLTHSSTTSWTVSFRSFTDHSPLQWMDWVHSATTKINNGNWLIVFVIPISIIRTLKVLCLLGVRLLGVLTMLGGGGVSGLGGLTDWLRNYIFWLADRSP